MTERKTNYLLWRESDTFAGTEIELFSSFYYRKYIGVKRLQYKSALKKTFDIKR